MFDDKVLLITGGTGSFGNAVLRRFLSSDLREIRIFSRDEKKQDDMRKKYNNAKLKFYIGDVRDYQSVLNVVRGVDFIYHAAALKQVPSCEFHPLEAVKTNVFRLPGVFGKWCKPNYNSVVATFCHNIARGLPIQINDPAASLQLVYVDDVVDSLVAAVDALLLPDAVGVSQGVVNPLYQTTLGELAAQIEAFGDCRTSLMSERVGVGLVRALYATYVSYLPNDRFAYEVQQHADPRGVFVEMLKTPDSGQFSYFTAHPGITRGGHYHHTKTEKFLVIKGTGLFRFRHLLTDERFELTTSGDEPQVVDTIPGWVHDITNVGNDELVVMLWANEVFDRANPDTVAAPI